MLTAILATKGEMQTLFDKGYAVAATRLEAAGCIAIAQMTGGNRKDGVTAVLLGLGSRRGSAKTAAGFVAKNKLALYPRFLKEVENKEDIIASDPEPVEGERGNLIYGEQVKVADLFAEGDMLIVSGVSKGKGFAGGVKRYSFAGGPRTHGQSDRERAPGSIGSGTTPGRVRKGKRMAGRMGSEKVTVRNLQVLKIDAETNSILVKGAVPGIKGGLIIAAKK